LNIGTLIIVFNILIFQAMVRGINIECGCGLKEGQMVGYRKQFKNFMFLVGCTFIFISKNRILYAKTFQ